MRELEEEACHELDEVVAIPKELLDNFFVDELDEVAAILEELLDIFFVEELDSSIAPLSPPSGPELLVSSPQAARSAAAVIRTIFPRHLLKSLAII